MPLFSETLLDSCRRNTTPTHGRRFWSLSFLQLVLVSGLVAAPAEAGTLVGAGTLDNPNDLTIILDGVGNELAFLDLSTTDGSTIAAAVAAYSPRGFRWANGGEVSELFDAFGIPYSVSFDSVTDLGLGTNSTEATSFISFLGATTGNASLGWVDDLTTATHKSYTCISVAQGCIPASFTNSTNSSFILPPNNSSGVYLVRDVPEPSKLGLLGAGLVAIGWRRRKRHA